MVRLLQGVQDAPIIFYISFIFNIFALFIHFKCCDRSGLGRRGNGVVCSGFGHLRVLEGNKGGSELSKQLSSLMKSH